MDRLCSIKTGLKVGQLLANSTSIQTQLIRDHSGEPQSRSDLLCAQIDSATAQWKAISCDQKLPYFCQLPYYQNLNTTLAPIFNVTTPGDSFQILIRSFQSL